MRKALASLTVLAAALLAAPAQSATSAVAGGGTDGVDRTARVTVKDRVIKLTNNRRRAHGCDNLRKNAALGRAAQKHTRKMANQSTLDHQLPREASVPVRIRREGYDHTLWAENIAAGQQTARAVVRQWMNSPDHRANILDCRLKHIGVGFARSDGGLPFWTQDFGRR